MKTPVYLQRLAILACIGVSAFVSTARCDTTQNYPLGSDILYVGDGGDNSVKRFSADNGKPLDGTNGKFATNGLHGPRGMLVAGGQLIVVDQNAGKNVGGEILQFRLTTGGFTGAIVAKRNPDGPFAPRGVILSNGVIFVANIVDDNTNAPGQVLAYSGAGNFLGELVAPPGITFHPRGVVIGPDGLLYVSSCPNFGPAGPTVGGQVLRFDPSTLHFIEVFISDVVGGNGQLNRPEGLVFGPDGRLYLTSFRNDSADFDSIRVYDGATGAFLEKMNLNESGQARAFAQALLFGPGGRLFVPITANGEVRRYNVTTKSYDVFIPAGSLVSPWFLTCGRTDAATLSYGD